MLTLVPPWKGHLKVKAGSEWGGRQTPLLTETQKASALPNPPVNGKKDGQRSTAAHREGYMQSEGADRTFSFSCSHHLSCAKLHLCDKT
jgi:hypothetical protein